MKDLKKEKVIEIIIHLKRNCKRLNGFTPVFVDIEKIVSMLRLSTIYSRVTLKNFILDLCKDDLDFTKEDHVGETFVRAKYYGN